MSKIENCPGSAGRLKSAVLQFLCPKSWNQLKQTTRPSIRHCQSCRQDIELATTEADLERLSKTRHCVAVDDPVIGEVMGSHRYRGE